MIETIKGEIMSIHKRITLNEINAAAHTIWEDKSTADAIAMETYKILNKSYQRKFAFFNGRSSRFLVGGLFYLLGFRYDSEVRQIVLAGHLGTSDTTIRLSYRLWLENFPDLFVDIIGKLAVNKDVKYFVLLDLKPEFLAASTRRP
jgi:hypothetical protein